MNERDDAEENRIALGQYLAAIRADRRMSLRQVEEATNKEVSNAYLSQIETGKIKQPSPNILHALSELYAIDYTNLMEKAGYIAASSTQTGEKRHGRVATFSEHNLTAEEQAALLEYLQFFRGRKKQGDQS